MEHFKLSFVFLLFTNILFGQSNIIEEQVCSKKYNSNLKYILKKSISTKNENLLVFISGSGPIPLFIETKNNSSQKTDKVMIAPEGLEGISDFDLLLLGKPGIPISCPDSTLNESFFFLDSLGKPLNQYKDFNFLDFYVDLGLKVLKRVKKKHKYKNIFILGHSQGARVSIELSTSKDVTGTVFMSADPLGRVASIIDDNSTPNGKREFYTKTLNSQDSLETHWGEYFYTWKSFSKPIVNKFLSAQKPVLIVYGSRDEKCPNCYLFQVLKHYNSKLTVIQYPDYNHNYFDSEKNNNWSKVLNDTQNWMNSILNVE